ncbi:acyl carrier protein [Streptomyces noursei]
MTRDEAENLVKQVLAEVVPDGDLTTLGPDEAFRNALGMDSLDFLSFIEILSERTGIRIDDEDTPRLTTLAGSTRFLLTRAE